VAVEPGGEFVTGDAGGDAAPRQSAKTYTYHGSIFSSERALVVRFLDDLRAAESFGAEVLALWAAATSDAVVSEGLRTVCSRERSHGELLAGRLQEIGGVPTAELSFYLRRATSENLASAEILDLEKVRDFITRYPDSDLMAKPIRDVIDQIEEDLETKALLSAIADDEVATHRWMSETFERLAAPSEPASTSGSGVAHD